MTKRLLLQYPPELEKRYTVKETIGSGGFAKVKLAIHKATGEKVAVKVMCKDSLGEDLHRVQLEIDALKNLSHRHICQLYEIIETPLLFCLIMEYAPGGELFDYIIARDRLKESEAVKFFRQITAAVAYCHSKGFVHRDLKPENLLLDEQQNLKLIDFGLASKPMDVKHQLLHTCCGSPAYAAPEVISGQPYIGTEADLWSMGVLLYALLCGFLPFDDDNTATLYRLIQEGRYKVPDRLSKESTRLIQGLLQVDPKRRLSVTDLLSHPWLCHGDRPPVQPFDVLEDIRTREVDMDIVQQMAIHMGVSLSDMHPLVVAWEFDKYTVLYLSMLKAKENGKIIKLSRLWYPADRVSGSCLPPGAARRCSAPPTVHFKFNLSLGVAAPDYNSRSIPNSPCQERKTGNHNKITLGVIKSSKSLDEITHARDKTPFTVITDKVRSRSCQSSLDKRRNMAVYADDSVKGSPSHHSMESRSGEFAGCGGRRRSSLTEFVRQLFSLGKRSSLYGGTDKSTGPRKVNKALYSVSTTSTHSAEHVLAELQRALHIKGVQIKKSDRFPNYLLRCTVADKRGKTNIVFELEVCHLPRMDLIGVRRKRVKGDTWEYKKLCEEILSIAKL
ncbi:maternal embryonic leucine zipper kinase-like [Bolinopsis microptera]|uniref:maternal embryonic leucine zipper kinase-like n=1 Tax=Bolinopsis microptera TaxID=2820187 RepID=UPI003078BE04